MVAKSSLRVQLGLRRQRDPVTLQQLCALELLLLRKGFTPEACALGRCLFVHTRARRSDWELPWVAARKACDLKADPSILSLGRGGLFKAAHMGSSEGSSTSKLPQ
eukprot:4844886-Amphidinium_carterae.1